MAIEFMRIELSLKDAKKLAIEQFVAEKACMDDGGADQFTRAELRQWKSRVLAGDVVVIGSYLTAMIACPHYVRYRDDRAVDAILEKYATTLGGLIQRDYDSTNPN
jgi:hypothetical protein